MTVVAVQARPEGKLGQKRHREVNRFLEDIQAIAIYKTWWQKEEVGREDSLVFGVGSWITVQREHWKRSSWSWFGADVGSL